MMAPLPNPEEVRLAAPAMLEALKQVWLVRPINWDDDDDPDQAAAWRAVESSIKQAEGRS